jgi:rhamnose transport system ATP-binding protein
MSVTEAAPVLELRHMRKAFGGLVALHDASLALRAGSVHALVGENGAGKSTLIKIVAGVYQPDAGEIFLDGSPAVIQNPAVARDAGVAVIYQEPTLFPDLNVAENIFMGRHPVGGRLRRIQWRRLRQDVRGLLARVGLDLDPRERLRGLSVADQQLVEVAKALSLNARVVVMDEPTASLTPGEVDRLFGIVRQLRDQGVAIIFIGHRLEEIFAVADRITILRDGQYVGTFRTSDITPDQVITHMVGRTLDVLFDREAGQTGEPRLEVLNLRRSGVFADISFAVREGEIVGLAGLVGAGRTEVARAIFGIDRLDDGIVRVDGKSAHLSSPRAALRHGVAYLPEDRQAQGLVLPLSISKNVTLPILREMARGGFLRPNRERMLAQEYGKRLRLRARSVDQRASDLSGGNQQKVVISKWLATHPRILILDEPTRGIDVGAKAEVHRLMGELARSGMAILMISSELPEILAMSDRVLVMREGRLVAEIDGRTATQEAILRAASGLAEAS